MVLVVMAIVMGLGIPAIQNFIIRSKTEGFAREIAVQMQRTRLEAIRMNREAAVFLDEARNELVSFVDADQNDAFNPGGGAFRTVDYEVARLSPPANVDFQDQNEAVGKASIDGFTDVDGETWLRFRPDGSVDDSGAFRISDTRGNSLEIRVAPAATGKVELRKWDPEEAEWRGAGDPAQPDYEPWEWK